SQFLHQQLAPLVLRSSFGSAKTQIPILHFLYSAGLYPQIISRTNFSNTAVDGFRCWNVSEGDIVAHGEIVDLQIQIRMLKDRLDLRTKHQFLMIQIVVKRLLTYAIAREDHRPIPLVPQSKCEHATKLADERVR